MASTIKVGADASEDRPNPLEMLTAHDLRIIKVVLEDGRPHAEATFGAGAVDACLQSEYATEVIATKERNKAIAALVSKDDIVAGMYAATQRILSGDEANSTAKGHMINGLQKLGNSLGMFEIQADPEEPIELEWIS